jgi:hypothetical protein
MLPLLLLLLLLQVTLLDPVRFPGAIKVFAREICRNDLLNFGRLHFFFPDSRCVKVQGLGSRVWGSGSGVQGFGLPNFWMLALLLPGLHIDTCIACLCCCTIHRLALDPSADKTLKEARFDHTQCSMQCEIHIR